MCALPVVGPHRDSRSLELARETFAEHLAQTLWVLPRLGPDLDVGDGGSGTEHGAPYCPAHPSTRGNVRERNCGTTFEMARMRFRRLGTSITTH